MKLSLSTNWCNLTIPDAAEIAKTAVSFGFDELELGFNTPVEQAAAFKNLLGEIPVGSVHAFCPVPLSAPHGSPELYALASADDDARALARVHVVRNVDFAADMGADCVVLHAGRVPFSTFLRRGLDSAALRELLVEEKKDAASPKYAKLLGKAMAIRRKRGAALLEIFKKEVASLAPVLEKRGVTLAFENLPYLEGFPDELETAALADEFAGAPVGAWFDTGHHRVRESHGWIDAEASDALERTKASGFFAGMHLNDVEDVYDDHFAPGGGKVDFAALEPLARSVRHVVFEPKSHVTPAALASGLALIRKVW